MRFIKPFKHFITKGARCTLIERGNTSLNGLNKIKRSIMTSPITKDSFVWIDLEMTGLDVSRERILQVACIITDTNLIEKHEGIDLIIHQPNELLDSMNDWCKTTFAKTGLTKAVQDSELSESEAEKKLYDYIKKYTDDQGTRYLAGNTVYMDKRFIEAYMPSVHSLLHYRIIDVSTVKELCRHWYPTKFPSLCNKKLVHKALDDIKESIEELQLYKKHIFIN